MWHVDTGTECSSFVSKFQTHKLLKATEGTFDVANTIISYLTIALPNFP